ncbi:MAG: hypothetical protein FWG87_01490 [Defluviitaleaceae bacterium]|nr:hypothetical protein [Defluviitaleaceae bacterium]
MKNKKRKQELREASAKTEKRAVAAIIAACLFLVVLQFILWIPSFGEPTKLYAFEHFVQAMANLQNATFFDEDFIQARITLKNKIEAAEELRDNTVVSESGRTIPTTVYWAPQAAHDELNAAINRAKATLGVLETRNMNIISGNYYTIPLMVDELPLSSSFTLNFDPEKITFIEMTDNTAVVSLPWHNPEQGWVAFKYIDNSPNADPSHTGLVNVPRFYAKESGEAAIAVYASWDYPEE